MGRPLLRSAFLNEFSCLGDACEDTCCKGWGMQLDAATRQKYENEAPELLDAVTSGEAAMIMRRDPSTDYCVKYDKGWCAIHGKYGDGFLGDACHFYPRVTRQLGDDVVMTATLSCPEVARLALFEDGRYALQEASAERLPYSLKDYLPETMTAAGALKAHQAFLEAAQQTQVAPERIMARLMSVAHSLERVDGASWADAAEFYFRHADSRLPRAEALPTDPYNLLHALSGLVAAAPQVKRPRLEEVIEQMERGIGARLDWEALRIATDESSYPAYLQTVKAWEDYGKEQCVDVLRRWIAAQVALAMLPFAGFGDTLTQRVMIIGMRFALVKLALMSLCAEKQVAPSREDIVKTVQGLSRFLDHLADPAMTVAICEETGWMREARLRGLIGDSDG